MELFVFGLSHKTAPVSVRERLAVEPNQAESYVQTLAGLPGLREAAIISTCNRVEIYGVFASAEQALSSLRGHLQAQLHPDDAPAASAEGNLFYSRVGREAVSHLFRVAASLDSLVVGEPQILGQIKDAFDLAVRAGTAGPVLGSVFPHAFRVAKKVRRDTGIAQNPVSVSSVAVDLLRQFYGGFRGRRVLLIGAGKMADLAARSLASDGAVLAVTNRTRSRAEDLAARLSATVEPFETLAQAIGRADVVISSTGAREPILVKATLSEIHRARKGRPLVIIDIAVPRDVDPSVAELAGVYLYDIDDLQKVVHENLKDRHQEAARAEAMVEEELSRFMSAQRGRAVGPTIAALRARFSAVARAEAERTLAGLPGADERTRRAVLAMADALVGKLMPAPSVALKKDAALDGELVQAAHRLFDLPPLQPVADDKAEAVAPEGGEPDGPPLPKELRT